MKTVLLAIEGREPHRSVMSFARQFCHKMQVALDILHVIDPGQEMPAAPELQKDKEISDTEREAAEPGNLHLLKSENPPKAIANYIDTHRNIVLAIYDGRIGENRKISSGTRAGETPMGFEKPLAVPLVVMRS